MWRPPRRGGFLDLNRQLRGYGDREPRVYRPYRDAECLRFTIRRAGSGTSEPARDRSVSSMERRVNRRSVGTRYIGFATVSRSIGHQRSIQGIDDAGRIGEFGPVADPDGATVKGAMHESADSECDRSTCGVAHRHMIWVRRREGTALLEQDKVARPPRDERQRVPWGRANERSERSPHVQASRRMIAAFRH